MSTEWSTAGLRKACAETSNLRPRFSIALTFAGKLLSDSAYKFEFYA
jgi:hypothetical protein